MGDPTQLATDTAVSLVVRRALDPLLNGIGTILSSFHKSDNTGAPDPAQRLAVYQEFMRLAAQIRTDLDIVGDPRMTLVGAAWSWPVYFSTFWQFRHHGPAMSAAVLGIVVHGREPVLRAAYDVGRALSEAIENIPSGAPRRYRDAVRNKFRQALSDTDTALVAMKRPGFLGGS